MSDLFFYFVSATAGAIVYEWLINRYGYVGRLRSLCGEVYQVVGVLASDSDQFDSDEVERVLDNLSAAANHEEPPHESLLPFLGKGE